MTPAVFAIPGDIATRTGGYIYERNLLNALRDRGHVIRHLQLPASFPNPTPADMATALQALAEVDASIPLILDGFLSGTLDPEGLANLRAPLVAMVHHPLGLESGLDDNRRKFLLKRERDNLALMRHVLVPSRHIATTLLRDFNVVPELITVAPPGFDPVTAPPHPSEPPLILSVGILHPRKGHNILLEAFAKIADLPWQAIIVGGTHDPAHAATLHARAAASDLRDRVRLAGELDSAELENLYGSATLMALATHYEGYGMVFGEAQRHGLPIVSCRTGAVPETVPESAGLLVPPDNPAAFAAALRKVLSDSAFRRLLAAGSAASGRALPTWTATAATVGTVLDRIADQGAR